MLERLTDQARLAVDTAGREAKAAGHGQVVPTHLLLGISVLDDRFAARAMKFFGITTELFRERMRKLQLMENLGSQEVPISRIATRALEQSMKEALYLGHSYVAPEHLLFGVLRIRDSVVEELLSTFTVDAATLRSHTLELLYHHTQ